MGASLKKLFTTLFLSTAILFANEYDKNVMLIESKLFPKIALMEKGVQNKTKKTLDIAILYKEIDYADAKQFLQEIQNQYPSALLGKTLHVTLKPLSRYTKLQTLPDVVIVLSYDAQTMQKIAAWANEHKILSFVYEPSDMRYGFVGSVHINKTVRPYLNKEIIKRYDFVFAPHLLQLSHFRQ